MEQVESSKAGNAGERAGSLEAQRQEKLTQPSPRPSGLSADEAALLPKTFRAIIAEHYDLVWDILRRRGLESSDAEDVLQETFLALHNYILGQKYPDDIPAMLTTFAQRKLSNHLRAKKRSPFSDDPVSSSSESPPTPPDLDRAMDLHKLARHLLPRLSPEHREVIEELALNGLSYAEAAEVLGIAEGTLRSRLMAAKRVLFALAEPLQPPSQRGPR